MHTCSSMHVCQFTCISIKIAPNIKDWFLLQGNDRREVKQFHYTGWPDFGVPDYPHPVISFIKRINNFKRTTPGPYVVHCSAGVGRTGTLMTVQAMMQMMEEEGKLDIFNFVLGLRHQRNYMVQTEVRGSRGLLYGLV